MISARAKALRLIVMLVGLGHGLIYVFLMPPWQHYDEPSHFEVAWLIGYKQRLPGEGQSDPVLSRAVMESMSRHNFYAPLAGPHVPSLSDAQLYLGYSQLGDPPLYYILAAPAIVALHGNAVEVQLYGARLMSLGLLAITLATTSQIARLAYKHVPQLQVMAPLTLGLIPAFVDLMSACNNTVAAVACSSLMMWAIARMLVSGLTLRNGLVLVTLGLLAGATASISLLMCIAIPISMLFAVLRGRHFRHALFALGGFGIVATLGMVGWGDAAYWYRGSMQSAYMRSADADGNAWLLLEQTTGQPRARTLQLLSEDAAMQLAGKSVRLSGRWRTDRSLELLPPTLAGLGGHYGAGDPVLVGSVPSAFSLTVSLPITFGRGWVSIDPGLPAGERLWMDDLELTLINDGASRNVLRNSDFAAAWPRLRIWETPWRNSLIWGLDEYNLLLSPLDVASTRWLFVSSAANVYATMWTTLGWGQVAAPSQLLFVCGGLFFVALAGHLLRRPPIEPAWRLITAICMLVLGAFTLLRGLQSLIYPPYLPVARYLFPVLPLFALWLADGWLRLGAWLRLVPILSVSVLAVVAGATLLFAQSFFLAQ